MIRLSVGERTN